MNDYTSFAIADLEFVVPNLPIAARNGQQFKSSLNRSGNYSDLVFRLIGRFRDMKHLLLFSLLAVLCVGIILWWQHPTVGRNAVTTRVQTQPISLNGSKTNEVAGYRNAIPSFSNNSSASGELDVTINPYAGGLREPCKSKREWNADFLKSFQKAKVGDPVRFELTAGVMAEGFLKIIKGAENKVSYISGELSAPEAGKFYFLTPPTGDKAGKAAGVVEFPASKTAYRIEPTGANGDPELWQRRLDEVVFTGMAKADLALSKATAEVVAQAARSNRLASHFSGQVPGEPQTILRQFKGYVSAVDPKAMTLSVKSAEGDHVFTVSAKTKYSRGGKPALFKDVGVGKAVEVVVNMRAQSDEAITVNIMAE